MFALCTALRTAVRIPAPTPVLTRNFSFTTFRRPTVFGLAPAGLASPPSTITGAIDALASRISASPALQSLQVRNGPRDTFDPSHRVRKRRAGFLARNGSRTGRAILKRRRLKGRKTLSH